MEIEIIDKTKYFELFSPTYVVFNDVAFNEINKSKVQKLIYFAFKDKKYRLGICVGITNLEAYSPFSAPFGGFTFLREDLKISQLDEAINLLKSWFISNNIKKFNIVLPPSIYNYSFNTKQINSLFRLGFKIEKADLNYVYDLKSFDAHYPSLIWPSARNKLNQSLNANLVFNKCLEIDECKIAFDIIVENRNEKSYTLRMNWNQLFETLKCVKTDFFLVKLPNNIPIASAVIFKSGLNTMQLIYWGDLNKYSDLKPMNYLAFKIFEYYHNCNVSFMDLGPSSENSIPNFGLSEFKESIGSFAIPKFTFNLDLI